MKSLSHTVPITLALLSLAGLPACESKVPIGTQDPESPDGAASTADEVGGADAPSSLEDGQGTVFLDVFVGPPDGMQGSGGVAVGGASGTGGAGSGGVGGGGGSDARRLDVGASDGPSSGGAPGGAIGSGGAIDSGGAPGGAIGSGGAPGGTIGGTGTVSLGGATGLGGAIATGGSTGSGGSTSPLVGPCDLYAAAGTPCVAAYSMVRVLASTYGGPLYQVRSGSSSRNTGTGGTTKDIGAVDGFADTIAQDAFCSGSLCTVSVLYDQSGKGNHLIVAKKGCYTGTASEDDYESSATKRSLTVAGHKVYALYTNAHEGYRNNQTTGMPTGNAAQGTYELADGTHSGTGCCWDFGNASTDNCYYDRSNALFFGTDYWNTGAGNGPWFMGDAGTLWPTDSGASCASAIGCEIDLPSMHFDFAFGSIRTQSNKGTISVGNAQSGSLATAYDGQLAFTWSMKGGIILGIGEDNSNSSYGTFYEGAITSGRPSDATDEAVFKNVKDAGYGR